MVGMDGRLLSLHYPQHDLIGKSYTDAADRNSLPRMDRYRSRRNGTHRHLYLSRANHFLATVFHHYTYNIHCRPESTVIVTLFRRILSFFYNYILTIAIKVLSLQQLTKITIYTIFYEKMFSCNNYALHGSYF